jgi:hypothetical protein
MGGPDDFASDFDNHPVGPVLLVAGAHGQPPES